MFRNPITQAIIAGQLFVNLPSLIIGLYTPFIIRQLSVWTTGLVSQEVIVFSILFGMATSWLWWSFSITYWRIWAFERVEDQQLAMLRKRAIQFLLIHSSSNSVFDRTEIRSRVQQEHIRALNDNTWVAQQMDLLFQDVNTVPQTDYGFNKRELAFLFGIRAALAIVGISLLIYSPLPFIGFIIIGIVFFYGDIAASAKHFRRRTPLMNVGQRGLTFHFPEQRFFYWDEIQSVQIDKPQRRMTLYLHHQSLPVQQDLKLFGIQDYGLLRKRIHFFMRQDVAEWQ
ncbi:MAG: hypothetical protein AAGK47_03440 [Bacteroidota bacterium]